MPRRLLIFRQSGYLTHIVAINLHTWWQTVQIQISWHLQKLTDLDIHCLQNRVYLGSAGQGLTSARSPWYYTFDLDVKLQPNKIILNHPDISVHWSFMSTLYCQWFGLLVRLYLCMTGTYVEIYTDHFPLHCWTRIYPAFANSVDPDQLASSEANWSGSALFAIKYLNLQKQSVSSNLIGWKLEEGVAS